METRHADAPGIPTYPWFDRVPPDPPLRTTTQLRQEGLRPGGPVVAQVVWTRRGKVVRRYDLYRLDQAKPKRSMTDAQAAALAKAQVAQRTCQVCGTVYERPITKQLCGRCRERARRNDLAETAATWILDPHAVMLDTETTDLDGYLVQVAIIDMTGAVLLSTLINPDAPITPEATAIHGISESDIATAPRFADMFDQLCAILCGKRIVTYNVAFDKRILQGDVSRMGLDAKAWARGATWGCAMELYSEWCGDWSDYYHDYRYQPLPGGDHSALGDCRATLQLLHRIIADAGQIRHGTGTPFEG